MRRIRITLAYDGTDFHGWQRQSDVPTIQGWLQHVLAELEGRPVQVDGSGRTDAGVHALAQVAAFSLENPMPLDNLRKAMNRLLPAAIRVLSVEEAPRDFHPRRQARSKTYEYRIYRGEVCSPFERRYLCHYPYPLDVETITAVAPALEGEHDFSAFAAADESDRDGESSVRTIFLSRAEAAGERLIYRVRGSGFLKHMVRNIVGTLLEVGRGRLGEGDVRALLTPGPKARAGPTAPPQGLFLVSVEY